MTISNFKHINMGFNYKLTEQIIKCFNEEDINGELDTLVYLDAIDSDTFIEKLLMRKSFNPPSEMGRIE